MSSIVNAVTPEINDEGCLCRQTTSLSLQLFFDYLLTWLQTSRACTPVHDSYCAVDILKLSLYVYALLIITVTMVTGQLQFHETIVFLWKDCGDFMLLGLFEFHGNITDISWQSLS